MKMSLEQMPRREELLAIFEDMSAIQTLPLLERTALMYYLKGIIAVMTGTIPMPNTAQQKTRAI